jgi:tetratricopeptide (TPR) repeat protein
MSSELSQGDLFMQRAGSHYAAHNYEQAINDCVEAAKSYPTHTYPLVLAGNSAFHQCDFPKAIDFYTRALKIDPANDYAYSWRGAARCAVGHYESALEDLNRAIELNPNVAEYYANRGHVHSSTGEHELAIKDQDKALELTGGNCEQSSAKKRSFVNCEECRTITFPGKGAWIAGHHPACTQITDKDREAVERLRSIVSEDGSRIGTDSENRLFLLGSFTADELLRLAACHKDLFPNGSISDLEIH